MKLFFSGNSPYARRARMAVREAGLSGKIEEVDLNPLAENTATLLEYGPGAKVPGLLTDSGTYLCELLVIGHYLDEASGGRLYPKDSKKREFAYHVDGIASLLMDSLFTRARENRRDKSEQSPGLIKTEGERARRAYDALESIADRLGEDVHMGTITAVACLGYADWRHPGDEWRSGRPKLKAWYDRMMQRPAMAETKPIF